MSSENWKMFEISRQMHLDFRERLRDLFEVAGMQAPYHLLSDDEAINDIDDCLLVLPDLQAAIRPID